MTDIFSLIYKIRLKINILRKFDKSAELLEERHNLSGIYEPLDIFRNPSSLIIIKSLKTTEVEKKCHRRNLIIYVVLPHFLIQSIHDMIRNLSIVYQIIMC